MRTPNIVFQRKDNISHFIFIYQLINQAQVVFSQKIYINYQTIFMLQTLVDCNSIKKTSKLCTHQIINLRSIFWVIDITHEIVVIIIIFLSQLCCIDLLKLLTCDFFFLFYDANLNNFFGDLARASHNILFRLVRVRISEAVLQFNYFNIAISLYSILYCYIILKLRYYRSKCLQFLIDTFQLIQITKLKTDGWIC
eukprot:TRINITY_DN23711_c0_g1_i2.p1 TRINITY_DN23711_c0_g1~~TRINITY_DN23711_c0_g1_i2.p1  ORF type:complete len:196 (+),score=-14.36 TRINITY_DN23711_c0_g1_i2:203-790(+)